MELTIFNILLDFAIAFVVGFCWAILFGTSRKVLYVAGLLGGMGHALRFVLIQLDCGLIFATLAASILIGLVGIFAAHRVNQPPVVFTMPACITMIPGMYAYRTMIAGIKSTDYDFVLSNPTVLPEMVHNFMLTISLLFTLAIGISIGVLLFRKESSRHISIKEMTK
ncbi:threonine/serine exporter family protein [Bacteroides propionicifaciens]|uniref:threonine/serine exporter family protein n=1 Tax=Bacteroides propionicifaciens TaxID=392838 RepID=UPI00036C7CE5|nr:threonine/serine exporter family protein [Bacteroides propionicifaciens]